MVKIFLIYLIYTNFVLKKIIELCYICIYELELTWWLCAFILVCMMRMQHKDLVRMPSISLNTEH